MRAVLFSISICFASALALAHEHSVSVCSATRADVCAHLGFEKPLNSSAEGKFMAHVMTPANQDIQDFKLDLFMDMGGGHGHGSAPVELKALGKNRFAVSNAWFVMQGEWLVRLDFEFDQAHHHIEIPIEIKQ